MTFWKRSCHGGTGSDLTTLLLEEDLMAELEKGSEGLATRYNQDTMREGG
jgi:hypothetical protein